MRCPSCQNENEASAAYCDMCGMDLNPTRPASPGARAAASAPAPPANPHQKRHTVFEPGPSAAPPPPAIPPAASPAPPRGGTDFFAQPPPPRPTFDPKDPFAAASLPPTRASVSPPIPHAGGPAAAPARPKAQTIVGSVGGAAESPSTGLVRGALFEYRGLTDAGRVHPLRVGRNVVGRGADCDVVLEDGRVSSQHAYVFIRAEDASFIDVSSNGSVVNGAVVHGEQVVLQNQAVLTLGGTTLVLVIVPEALLSRRSS